MVIKALMPLDRTSRIKMHKTTLDSFEEQRQYLSEQNTLYNCLINQSIDRSIDQSVNQSIDQSINRSINQSIDQSINSLVEKTMNEFTDQSNK